jgi:hypothetical protein
VPLRIWDISPEHLCRAHLLGEHRELHAIWSVLTNDRRGYARHPETLRWRGKLRALWLRHEALVAEMRRRGYRHASPLDEALASGEQIQDTLIDSVADQIAILQRKGCDCRV